ncbi:hypothetical protein [Streptomyces sp. BK208]|uniref:hypothetical protein n=1 Tax=Streptomyces sp. BK208 TaxID=2512150 RepID=UPI00105D993A|nr:hypothetical protein [Streptomyces sp. BK208]
MKFFGRAERGGELDLSDYDVEDLELGPAPTPATPEDLRWARLAEEARFSGLTDVQRSAERWGATILVITGTLTTLTVVRGPSDLAALENFWPDKLLVGILAALSLLFALASVILAAMAAQGSAVKMIASGPRYKEESLKAASTANSYLICSRRLAVAVIPFYLGAIGFLSYAPQASQKPPVVIVKDSNGSSFCGTGIKRSKGEFLLQREDKPAIRLKPAEIASVSSSGGCGKSGAAK